MQAKVIAQGPQILIVERDDWHAFYAAEREALAAAAGRFLLACEHVGSTAVPGLAGKPVIDVLAGVKTLEDAPAIAERLRELGYIQIPFQSAGKDLSAERLFFLRRPLATPEGVDLDHPGYNIHIVTMDRFRQDDQLLLRDYLREHPECVAEYQQLKCEIVVRIADYRAYTPAKSQFIERVLAAARG